MVNSIKHNVFQLSNVKNMNVLLSKMKPLHLSVLTKLKLFATYVCLKKTNDDKTKNIKYGLNQNLPRPENLPILKLIFENVPFLNMTIVISSCNKIIFKEILYIKLTTLPTLALILT